MITTGMLWFDNSKSPLETKVQKAVDYYTKKHEQKPTLCLVHPSMLDLPEGRHATKMCDVIVMSYRPVLPGHLWIGIEDVSETQ